MAVLLGVVLPCAVDAQSIEGSASTKNDQAVEQLRERLQQIEEQHQKELADLRDRLGLVEK